MFKRTKYFMADQGFNPLETPIEDMKRGKPWYANWWLIIFLLILLGAICSGSIYLMTKPKVGASAAAATPTETATITPTATITGTQLVERIYPTPSPSPTSSPEFTQTAIVQTVIVPKPVVTQVQVPIEVTRVQFVPVTVEITRIVPVEVTRQVTVVYYQTVIVTPTFTPTPTPTATLEITEPPAETATPTATETDEITGQ